MKQHPIVTKVDLDRELLRTAVLCAVGVLLACAACLMQAC